jgi:putative transposase
LNGRKRYLLVDRGGLVLKAVVHPANVADRDGAGLVLEGLTTQYPTLRHLWVDAGYADKTVAGLGQALGLTVHVVRKSRRWFWCAADQEPPPLPKGFQVLPRRWVVERTLAWLGRYHCLSKDDEDLSTTEEAWISLAMFMLMLARLTT